jgi:hypothetical protein
MWVEGCLREAHRQGGADLFSDGVHQGGEPEVRFTRWFNMRSIGLYRSDIVGCSCDLLGELLRCTIPLKPVAVTTRQGVVIGCIGTTLCAREDVVPLERMDT